MATALKGKIQLAFNTLETAVDLQFFPDQEDGDYIAPKDIENLLVNQKITPPSIIDIELMISKLARAKEETKIEICHGIDPISPVAESITWNDISIPKDVKPFVDSVVASSSSPQIVQKKVEKIKSEPIEKEKGFFKKKETQPTFTYKETIIPVQIEENVLKLGFSEKGEVVGTFVPPKQGKTGKNVFGKNVQPEILKDPLFHLGKGLEKQQNEVIATESGIIRIGKNWADLLVLKTPFWKIDFDETINSITLTYRRGDVRFKEPNPRDIYDKTLEFSSNGIEIITLEELTKAIATFNEKPDTEEEMPLSKNNDGVIKIEVNRDATEATLTINKGVGFGKKITIQEVFVAIRNKRFVNVDTEKIKKEINDFFNSKDVLLSNYVIAKGSPSERGLDKKIEVLVNFFNEKETREIKEKLLGEILEIPDIKIGDITNFAFVKRGDQIAKISPTSIGKNGLDVYGNIIQGLPGNDPVLKYGTSVKVETSGIFAAIDGLLAYKSSENELFCQVLAYRDGIVQLLVSTDGLNAKALVVRALGAGKKLTEETVYSTLKTRGIKFGEDKEAIKNAVDSANRTGIPVTFTIAKGRLPVAPDSLVIHWDIDINDKKALTSIQKGILLATVTKQNPNSSLSGYDVYGKQISQQRETNIKTVEHDESIIEEYKEDKSGYLLRANKSGELFNKNGKYFISNERIITGDIDSSSGNIRFTGNLKVDGGIKAGMVVIASGDIIVKDATEDCLISSDGSIVLGNGIRGSGKGIIRARKIIKTSFAENSRLLAGSEIQIKKRCLNCIVKTNSLMYLDLKEGCLVGGMIRATKGLRTFDLGNERGKKTEVSFGQDYLVADQIEVTEKEISKLQFQLVKLNDKLKTMTGKEGKEEELTHFRKLKVVAMKAIEQKSRNLFSLHEKYEQHIESSVIVINNVYPGVILESHGRYYEVKQQRKGVVFTFDTNTGSIVCKPLPKQMNIKK